MREVAAASGILAGSLYHHFDSKEAIAVELVEAYHADLVRVVREFGSVPADPLSALRGFALEIAAVSFRHAAALQISLFARRWLENDQYGERFRGTIRLNIHGAEGIRFCTRAKAVTQRWHGTTRHAASYSFPSAS